MATKKNRGEEVLAEATGAGVEQPGDQTGANVESGSAFDQLDGETVVRELDGTWYKAVGAEIVGRISHAYSFPTRKDDGSEVDVPGLALILTAPTTILQDGARVEAQPGMVVGVTVAGKLGELLQFEPGTTVGIRVDKKVKLAHGRSTWSYTSRTGKGAKRRPGGNPLKARIREAAPPSGNEDFINF